MPIGYLGIARNGITKYMYYILPCYFILSIQLLTYCQYRFRCLFMGSQRSYCEATVQKPWPYLL